MKSSKDSKRYKETKGNKKDKKMPQFLKVQKLLEIQD